jgi:RNA polymerase II subunit A small phosphatase-like protein
VHSSTEKPSSRAGVKKSSKSKKKKKSIWSKLASAFFHCTWSKDNPHAVDIDEHAPGVSDPSSSHLETYEKPATLVQPKEESAKEGATAESSSTPNDKEEAMKTTDEAIPLTVAPDLVPIPTDDPAVVVPPSPSTQVRTEDPESLTSGSVQPPGSTGREHENESEDTSFTDDDMDKDIQEAEDEEERLIREGGAGIPIGPDGMPRPLLPPIAPQHLGRKCLVLDLDETLVHSSFKVSRSPHCDGS